jgi:hypothetical protein
MFLQRCHVRFKPAHVPPVRRFVKACALQLFELLQQFRMFTLQLQMRRS